MFRPGRAKLTITAPGYESRTIEVNIMHGKIFKCNMALQLRVTEFKTA